MPHLSDRSLSNACGLAPGTVAKIRTRATDHLGPSRTRLGRDGRTRPVNPREQRERVSEALAREPGASDRSIAREIGCAVSTVRSARGESPARHLQDFGSSPAKAGQLEMVADRAFCGDENRERFARWFDAREMSDDDWASLVDALPRNRLYEIALQARQRSCSRTRLADALEEQARRGERPPNYPSGR